jgi:uncharacterized protein
VGRVVHFEVHVEDFKRARAFYSTVLGWEFTQASVGDSMEYWLIKTGSDNEPGIDGGMVQRQGNIDGTAVIAYVCTADVASVDDTVALVTRHGGQIALPKMPVPGIGWLVYAKDTEGNIFGMLQTDPKATLTG